MTEKQVYSLMEQSKRPRRSGILVVDYYEGRHIVSYGKSTEHCGFDGTEVIP